MNLSGRFAPAARQGDVGPAASQWPCRPRQCGRLALPPSCNVCKQPECLIWEPWRHDHGGGGGQIAGEWGATHPRPRHH